MKFSKRVFFWAGVYGIIVLFPMYFLEKKIGLDYPPVVTHPEHFYGFIGVALAWQFAFLMIARDPVRFRPLMIPAIVEKFLPAGTIVVLFLANRISGAAMAPFLLDFVLGGLFIASYRRLSGMPTQGS